LLTAAQSFSNTTATPTQNSAASSSSDSSSSLPLIAGAAVGGAAVLASLVGFFVWYKRRNANSTRMVSAHAHGDDPVGMFRNPVYSHAAAGGPDSSHGAHSEIVQDFIVPMAWMQPGMSTTEPKYTNTQETRAPAPPLPPTGSVFKHVGAALDEISTDAVDTTAPQGAAPRYEIVRDFSQLEQRFNDEEVQLQHYRPYTTARPVTEADSDDASNTQHAYSAFTPQVTAQSKDHYGQFLSYNTRDERAGASTNNYDFKSNTATGQILVPQQLYDDVDLDTMGAPDGRDSADQSDLTLYGNVLQVRPGAAGSARGVCVCIYIYIYIYSVCAFIYTYIHTYIYIYICVSVTAEHPSHVSSLLTITEVAAITHPSRDNPWLTWWHQNTNVLSLAVPFWGLVSRNGAEAALREWWALC
jgi:hypothetical protein